MQFIFIEFHALIFNQIHFHCLPFPHHSIVDSCVFMFQFQFFFSDPIYQSMWRQGNMHLIRSIYSFGKLMNGELLISSE